LISLSIQRRACEDRRLALAPVSHFGLDADDPDWLLGSSWISADQGAVFYLLTQMTGSVLQSIQQILSAGLVLAAD
jgi:hypothetical protein